ncbi:MAG: ABC-2 transporter permease [Eubacteriales bacterium]|nr:ABC-2 transporter permease [Eubacteriales bacterium]
MKAVIYKEFLTIWKQLLLALLLLLCLCVYTYSDGKLAIMPLAFVWLPMITISAVFGADLVSQIDKYLAASPLEARTIVLGRYAFIWLMCLPGIFSVPAISWFAPQQSLPLPWYAQMSLIMLLAAGTSAVELPIIYKFDTQKASVAFMFIYVIAFNFLLPRILPPMVSWLQGQSQPEGLPFVPLSLAGLGLTLVLNFISYRLSVKIYNKNQY